MTKVLNAANLDSRNIAVKFIVTELHDNDPIYMCPTNWSKSYSAGVLEFNTEEEALKAAEGRTDKPVLFGFNNIGERII